jgi:hypothetical protein
MQLSGSTSRMCFIMATNYLNGASIQLARLAAADARASELETQIATRANDPDWQTEVTENALMRFLDAHFYLSVLGELDKLLERMIAAEEDSLLTEAWHHGHEALGDFRRARNHFEHMDERFDDSDPASGPLQIRPGSFKARSSTSVSKASNE